MEESRSVDHSQQQQLQLSIFYRATCAKPDWQK